MKCFHFVPQSLWHFLICVWHRFKVNHKPFILEYQSLGILYLPYSGSIDGIHTPTVEIFALPLALIQDRGGGVVVAHAGSEHPAQARIWRTRYNPVCEPRGPAPQSKPLLAQVYKICKKGEVSASAKKLKSGYFFVLIVMSYFQSPTSCLCVFFFPWLVLREVC